MVKLTSSLLALWLCLKPIRIRNYFQSKLLEEGGLTKPWLARVCGSCPQKFYYVWDISQLCTISCIPLCNLVYFSGLAVSTLPLSVAFCKNEKAKVASLLTFLMRHKNTYLHTEDFKVAFFSNASNHNWCIMMQINCCLRLGTLLK